MTHGKPTSPATEAVFEASGHALSGIDLFHAVLQWVVLGINAATVLVLIWGVIYGLVRFIATERMRLAGEACDAQRAQLRRQVGFYILFALELLIAADIIETMASPTLEHLGILAGIALVRIVIGYALGKELGEIERGKTNPATNGGTP